MDKYQLLVEKNKEAELGGGEKELNHNTKKESLLQEKDFISY